MFKQAVTTMRLAAVLLGLLSTSAVGTGQSQAGRSFSGVVTHVADGDTLDVTVGDRAVKIRLEGIDAPERGQPFSAQARTHLRVLTFSQRVVVHVRNTDRYGRLVARVIVGTKDLSEEMVAAGLAWHYLEYSSDARLALLEKQARNKGLGLWADRAPVPPWLARRPNATTSRSLPTAPARPGSGAESRSAAVAGPYHGNVSSHVYHAPGCRDYDCKNCREVFNSRFQAEAAGYRPHDACVFGKR
jgi:micrococcal nuclease